MRRNVQLPLFSELEDPCPDCGGRTRIIKRTFFSPDLPDEEAHECRNPARYHTTCAGTASTVYEAIGCGWIGEWMPLHLD